MEAASGRRIRRARRQAVDVDSASLVDVRRFDERPQAPYVVQPAAAGVDLAEWGSANHETVERYLREAGAILYRGFDLSDVAAFERAATALTSDLYGGYGDLPRESGGERIYKSTPYPNDVPILFHNESSHLTSWPMRISFFCILPSEKGGETPIADCRVIAQRLDPEVAAEFKAKGLRYVRNFVPGVDVGWQQFFQTDDRAEVDRVCAESGADYEWTGEDSLRVSQPRSAMSTHPTTGEEMFFNQIQLHHPYHLPEGVRSSLMEILPDAEHFPRNVTFGDGSAISDDVAEHCLKTYWDNCIMFPWQPHDIIQLDNMLTAHARMPFEGERRIAVAMAGMSTA